MPSKCPSAGSDILLEHTKTTQPLVLEDLVTICTSISIELLLDPASAMACAAAAAALQPSFLSFLKLYSNWATLKYLKLWM